MNMATLTKSILQFADKERYTCLMTLFEMMLYYNNKTGKYPDSTMPMFLEIETTALHLIKMAEDNQLNMDNILNWTADNGITLFWLAACYSESLASELLKKNVVITTVNNSFQVPTFKVS